MLVRGSPGILYSCHVYAYIMNAENTTIFAPGRSARAPASGTDRVFEKEKTYLNADRERVQPIGDVRRRPILRCLDDVALQCVELYEWKT